MVEQIHVGEGSSPGMTDQYFSISGLHTTGGTGGVAGGTHDTSGIPKGEQNDKFFRLLRHCIKLPLPLQTICGY